MLRNFLFLLLVSLEPVWVHYMIFPKTGVCSLATLLIWMQYFLFFAFVFTFSRAAVAFVIIFESAIILLLTTYHHYFAEPLTLMTIFSQTKEGMAFALRSPSSLFTLSAFGFIGFLLLKLIYILCWYHPFRRVFLIRLTAFIPFICLALMSYGFFHNSKFEKRDFNCIAADFGYTQAWGYELVTKIDRENLIERIIEDSASEPLPVPEELKNIRIPENVYVIQLESIDYGALIGTYNDKKLMPFTLGLVPDSCLYVVKAHDKEASANADFSVLTGSGLYISMFTVMYNLIPPIHYDKMFTLPKLFKSQGYMTRFYHGFEGGFFKRVEHMKAMGFDKIWFAENLPLSVKQGAWGYNDADLLGFVIEDNRQNPAPKNFNFIITVSSHEDFEIGNKHLAIVKSPSGMTERFYNAAHYVDEALKRIVASAPQNSLFIIYSDHLSKVMTDSRTFMLVYQKGKPFETCRHTIEVNEVAEIIKSLSSQLESSVLGAQ